MYAANTPLIRIATEADADSLTGLAELTAQAPLAGRLLVAQAAGTTVGAISLKDGRSLSDPDCLIGDVVPALRARAQALMAYEAEPSLPVRMVAALPESYRSHAAALTEPVREREPARRLTVAKHRRRRVRRLALATAGAGPSSGRS